MKPITVWKLFNVDTKEYELNHIEDGHCEKDYPTQHLDHTGKIFDQQKGWSKGKWIKSFAQLDDKYKVII